MVHTAQARLELVAFRRSLIVALGDPAACKSGTVLVLSLGENFPTGVDGRLRGDDGGVVLALRSSRQNAPFQKGQSRNGGREPTLGSQVPDQEVPRQ